MYSRIRNKTFQIPVPQTKKNYKNDTLTKSRVRDEELTFVQTASSLALKSVFHFLLFLCLLHSHQSGFIPYSVSRILSEDFHILRFFIILELNMNMSSLRQNSSAFSICSFS